MRNISKSVYKFSELSKSAKEKAKQTYYTEVGTDDNNDQFQDSANEILSFIGFKDSKASYSLGSSQGDGLTYSFKLYSSGIVEVLKMYQNNEPAEEGYGILEELHNKLFEVVEGFPIDESFINNNDITIYTEGSSSRYSHKYTKNIEIESNEEDYSYYTENLQEIFKQIYYTVCDFLEKTGYEDIYAVMSDEEFSELSDSNDYEYYEDGTLFH